VDEARLLFARGLEAAGERGDLAARMTLGLANHSLRRGEPARALDLLREALPHAERAGDRVLTGRIVNNIGIALLDAGRPEAALAEFRRALELRRGLGYRTGEVINLHNIGDTYLRMGEVARAFASFEQSRELAKECAWERGVVMNEPYLAYLRGLGGEDVIPELAATANAAVRIGELDSALTARWFSAKLRQQPSEIRVVHAEAVAAGFANLAALIAAENTL
jgi:tetratricopeptide (TPR) repeat protein